MTPHRKSSGFVLRSLDDPDTAPRPEQLIGRQLVPVPFMPEAGRPVETDGAPLTKFGGQLRETMARLQKLDLSQIPLGLVRHAEALNADTDENLAGLSRPVARPTEYGLVWSARITVNAPLLMGWLINGRALRRLAAKLGHDVEVVTSASDHDTLSLPTMRVHDPEHVLELVHAQRELLGFSAYAGEQRDLVDSIASHGVLEAPDVVLTQLVSDSGTAWTAETAEGARRSLGAQLGMETIAGRDVASLATKHWLTPTPALRDLSPDDIRGLAESLTFPDSTAAQFFPGKDTKTWLATTATQQPAAVAWQLMRTMSVNLILAVQPNSRARERFEHPVAATIQELIRGYHVNGKAKESWQQADVDGLVAITLIDMFLAQNRIDAHDRAVWLGQDKLTWDNPLNGTGADANLLTSTVRLVASLTVEGATFGANGNGNGLSLVRDVLRDNGVSSPGPKDRARMAVAQAMVTLNIQGSGHENQVAAAMQALFRDRLLWRGDEHLGGNWTHMLGVPLSDLEAKARAELAVLPPVHEPVRDFGPAQRALGALGMTALIVNPAMLAAGRAVTQTAKGKTNNVSAADPGRLVARMLADNRGIDQLVDAITALVAGRTPGSPADRQTHEELGDLMLREMWLGTTRPPSADESPAAAYMRRLSDLVDVQLAAQHADAEDLRTVTADGIVGEEDDEDATPLYETIGVPDEIADRARAALRALDEFFTIGKAYSRATARFGR